MKADYKIVEYGIAYPPCVVVFNYPGLNMVVNIGALCSSQFTSVGMVAIFKIKYKK